MTRLGEPQRGLEVSGVTVRFGRHTALDDVSLRVRPGETVALVGPSGSGKSTLLRVIAGLEHGLGRVSWDGHDIGGMPTEQRSFGLMFQDHALFPHRDVADNVGFGLRMLGRSPVERRRRVTEVLGMVGLAGFEDRTIDTLSGGEAQRVALARAVAPSPRLLMLDEPLGSLDRVLRDRLADDLRRVLAELGVAAIHVTHDQEEAYAVADRLAVMRDGRIERDGPAADVWAEPASAFVARFLGHRNVLDSSTAQALGLGSAPVVIREAAVIDAAAAVAEDEAVGPFPASVVEVRFRGATSLVTFSVQVAGRTVELEVHRDRPPSVGDVVSLAIDVGEVRPLSD